MRRAAVPPRRRRWKSPDFKNQSAPPDSEGETPSPAAARRRATMRCNLKKWALRGVSQLWPKHFRWTHPPIVIHRHAPIRHSVKLNLEGLETRESPTSVFWLDPLVAAIVANGLMSQLTSSVPALQVPSDSTVYCNPGSAA